MTAAVPVAAHDAGEGEPIPLSALQHAVYCLRQAALIHLERLWADNRFTAEGDILHAVADKGGSRKRSRRGRASARRGQGLSGLWTACTILCLRNRG
ncbi:hypothetical protein FHS81_002765 [Pseudochelatococcus contaminans]|uniref:DUF83 domain-containing protein n=1 Tax=Pseudochelatococcus contaminans TaxID=1538103 RepID=A0A7W6EI40_9HYPH|nr:hypothetical protein [Pseudochelatococcus contaminans]